MDVAPISLPPALEVRSLVKRFAGFSAVNSLDLGAGLAMMPLAGAAALSMAVVQGWHGPRAPRIAFRKRPAALLLMGVIEISMAGTWAGLAVLGLSGNPWLLAPLAYIIFVVATARALKR